MSVNEMSPLEAALYYAGLDWQVFPCYCLCDGVCSCGQKDCRSPGKHPRTSHGFKDATTDPDEIRAWWTMWPDANIGIRTGYESGIWVLDLDGDQGLADWERLVSQHGPIPETPTVRTGGGGLHLYFAYPTAGDVKCRTKIHGYSIDVRGDGGYVIAPPSNHPNGVYLWEIAL